MKKLVPFIFIAVMAGLLGAKIAIAEDTAVSESAVQTDLRS